MLMVCWYYCSFIATVRCGRVFFFLFSILTFSIFAVLFPFLPRSAAKRNCVGAFTLRGACSQSCGRGSTIQTYIVSTPTANGGNECLYTNGTTRSVVCNTQSCRMRSNSCLVLPFTCVFHCIFFAFVWIRGHLLFGGNPSPIRCALKQSSLPLLSWAEVIMWRRTLMHTRWK